MLHPLADDPAPFRAFKTVREILARVTNEKNLTVRVTEDAYAQLRDHEIKLLRLLDHFLNRVRI